MGNMYVVGIYLVSGQKFYASSINMRCKEEKDIQLVEDINKAKRFDYFTALNIQIMNWWGDIGEMFIEEV
jgi:hypothetical protein